MDVPVQMRGKFYNTNGSFKCPNYSRCILCSGCDKYNPQNFMCFHCESSKPYEMICRHTDEQQRNFLKVMTMFNKPLAHVDDQPKADIKDQVGQWLQESEINELEETLANKIVEY